MVVLCVIFVILFTIINAFGYLNGLFFLQSNGYSVKEVFDVKLFGNRWCFLELIIYVVLSRIIMALYFNLIVFGFFLVLDFIIMLLGLKKKIYKIKYTKRVIRLLFVSILTYFIFLICVIKYVNIVYLIFYNIIGVFAYLLILILSLVLLYPIEKIICLYYLDKAKRKLKTNKKLIKIGITGSYGKTSVKNILNGLMSTQYNVLSTPESYNTPLGISKTINQQLNDSHEVFICEMGAKRADEIKYLCNYVGVDTGIITAVGRQHTNTFKGIDGVYKTKKELPNYLNGKFCVFNLMNKLSLKMYGEYVGKKTGVFVVLKRKYIKSQKMLKDKRITCKGYCKKCIYNEYQHIDNYYAKNVILTEFGSEFDIYFDNAFCANVKISLLGTHNIINVLLAIAMARHLNVEWNNILLGLSQLKQIKSRLEKFVLSSGAIVINNGYNSNIDSVKSSLEVLNLFNKKNKVVVTPGLIDTENDYVYNKNFGKIIAKYSNSVIVVKEKNKNAIYDGLLESGFDREKINFVSSFNHAKKIIENSNSDCVFLLENDLPDNYS